MSFLEDIFAQLQAAKDLPVVQRRGDRNTVRVTGRELLQMVSKARSFLAAQGLKKGDRCALLGGNSIRWIAMDLAMMAEGLIVVPLYARQAAGELIAMMQDCSPSLICCGDHELAQAIAQGWPEAPPRHVFEDIFETRGAGRPGPQIADSDPVTIIYTSGTSGDAKGVVLTAGNVKHMLKCTSERLSLLMEKHEGQERVFHYLPFCFAGSWITLLTCLMRQSRLILNTDLNKLAGEMRSSEPDYFLNVPALLERMRRAVDEQLWQAGGLPQTIYSRAKAAWMRRQDRKSRLGDGLWLGLARAIIFPAIRKKMIGPKLRALICGSAPLNAETQLYFMMLGIPVLQVYGLTETTAICTMDDPGQVEPGKVGRAIEGISMKLGENDEILVKGPNIFPGYWNRPQETAKVLCDGWFHTGDQGTMDNAGNWQIIGRIKNLIILGSGHNIAPEPIEDKVLQYLPGAQHVVVIGNGRGYLSAIVTGTVNRQKVQAALDEANSMLPHYKQIRAFHVSTEPFSIENGLLTANGKLKRDTIAARFKSEIEEMYPLQQAV